MNKNLADITIVVDKSGSMHSVRSDAEGGINSFLSDQAKQDGSANITLVEFSTDWRFVYHATPVSSSMRYTLSPSGGTALLDAVGNAINDTGRRLAAMKEKDRPGVVTFVIVTDGQENSSKEFTRAKIKEMIEHQQRVYNWKFMFLGANQDAFAEAASIGIDLSGVAKYKDRNTYSAYNMASGKMSGLRMASMSGNEVKLSFSQDELKSLDK